jgi:hypothetical protein
LTQNLTQNPEGLLYSLSEFADHCETIIEHKGRGNALRYSIVNSPSLALTHLCPAQGSA